MVIRRNQLNWHGVELATRHATCTRTRPEISRPALLNFGAGLGCRCPLLAYGSFQFDCLWLHFALFCGAPNKLLPQP